MRTAFPRQNKVISITTRQHVSAFQAVRRNELASTLPLNYRGIEFRHPKGAAIFAIDDELPVGRPCWYHPEFISRIRRTVPQVTAHRSEKDFVIIRHVGQKLLALKTLRCAPLETYEWQLRCSGANTVGAPMTAAVKQIGNSWRFMRFTIGNLLRSSADRMRLCYETGNDLLKSCFVFRSIRSRITTYLSWQMADLRCGFDQINSNIPYRLSSEYSSFVVGIDSADRTAVWPRPV